MEFRSELEEIVLEAESKPAECKTEEEDDDETEMFKDFPQSIVPEEPIEEKPKLGIVANCNRLNVRRRPRIDASIICEIPVATKVIVDESKSTEDFYKVFTEAGIEGFCMKQYISISN